LIVGRNSYQIRRDILSDKMKTDETKRTTGAAKTKTLEEIKSILSQHKKELREKYKVKEIGIFGSYVRGEQKKKSDVDVLVKFEEPIGLFEFANLQDHIADLLRMDVDLVFKDSIRQQLKDRILREAINV